MYTQDTIAAIATPPGSGGGGGVAIIRISGPGALETAGRLFKANNPGGIAVVKERFLHAGLFVDPSTGAILDSGFLVYMKSPRTYTGEDVVELHCHGGFLISHNLLGAVLRAGARAAEPGEFTRRAFLNGKLDLAQAEAVADVIGARTGAALASARGRLKGVFSRKVAGIKDVLVGLLVRVEAGLDFPEEETSGLPKGEMIEGLGRAEGALKKLLSTYEEGLALREGFRVLILGRPNAGKSSLLNVLLKEERAIVTEVPGTTRDIIEEAVIIKGLPVKLMDTAGLREGGGGAGRVETIGVERAREKIRDAGLVLYVVDVSSGELKADIGEIKAIGDKKVIVVGNKTDLTGEKALKRAGEAFKGYKTVFISALKEEGIEGLEEGVFEAATGHGLNTGEAEPGELVASARHKEALSSALDGIGRVKVLVDGEKPMELVADDLRWSVDRLGEITGETTTDDILDRIFSEFCIGK
ncbi:MAG: tRNA uridine-5-carboxymethylaminomethyl(34) synthesis GTPase MnmE [Thermodesulfobacteriota bacterium]